MPALRGARPGPVSDGADRARPAYVRGTREDEWLNVSLWALVCAAWLCGDVVASRVVRADSLA
jgi:hypothetical protein